VAQVHAQDAFPGLQEREVDGQIRLGAGVGLDVHGVGLEELPGSRAGEVLDLVDELATAVVAFAGEALRVFVRQDRPCGFQNGLGDKVLGCDQLELVGLPPDFSGNRKEDFRIHLPQVGKRLGHRFLVAPRMWGR
jgi:hypothetical protein